MISKITVKDTTFEQQLLLSLSSRERQVMDYLIEGYTNREIAADLFLSIKTVDTHRGHILRRLGLRNNVDLVRFALRNGVIQTQNPQ